MKKNLVVLTGAGISQESGIKTFRDLGGVWQTHNVLKVASLEAWYENPELVLEFYNQRHLHAGTCMPNIAHTTLKDLEDFFEVKIITQNTDDLHEKAGSSSILHLHGELNKVKSEVNYNVVYDWAYNKTLKIGDLCENGTQLRPHVVLFGEDVPNITKARELVREADIFVIIGTSLAVYPASELINYTKKEIPKFIIDPNIPKLSIHKNIEKIPENATIGVPIFANILLEKYL